MIRVFDGARFRRRRKRALFAAALCSASFLAGHYLFGDEPEKPAAEAPSLLSQYLNAKQELAPKFQPSVAKPIQAPPADKAPEVEPSEDKSPAIRSIEAESSVLQPVLRIAPRAEKSPVELAKQTQTPTKAALSKTPASNPAPASTTTSPAGTLNSTVSSLKATAVSAASDLPFVPATPLPPDNEVRHAVAEAGSTSKPVVASASAPVAAPQAQFQPPPAASVPTISAAPAAKEPPIAAAPAVKSADEENLPPIVPAWMVPRPGTRKKAQPALPTTQAEAKVQAIPAVKRALPAATTSAPSAPAAQAPATAMPEAGPAAPAAAAPRQAASSAPVSYVPAPQPAPTIQIVQHPIPQPLRVELSSDPTPSPALLPPAAPQAVLAAFPAKQTDRASFARLPAVEPSLLPAVGKSPHPIPLEIVNPHVVRATFEAPVERASAPSPQHVDDLEKSR